jgi:hypothetical protein
MSELNDRLNKQLEVHKARHAATLKERYNYAKQVGFTATEAVVLQNWNKSRIDQLAIERGYIKEHKG